MLNDNQIQTVGDLLFVGNVGEEELGNLRGIKRIFDDHRDVDGMVGLEPLPDGNVLVLGTGSHRYEVTFKGPGGHSYAAFGQVPSAIHGMGRAIAKIADVQTPSNPKTTFTVGTVGGGTSVNTIAPDARMAVDIRSDENEALLATEKKILAAIDEAVAEENRRWNVSTLNASSKLIGDRPGGRTPADSAIVHAATRANTAFGQNTLLTGASTDANVPMSLGIPAIIVGGGGKTGGFHALSEWIDLADAWRGAQNTLVTVLGLVGVQGVSDRAREASAAQPLMRYTRTVDEPLTGSLLPSAFPAASSRPTNPRAVRVCLASVSWSDFHGLLPLHLAKRQPPRPRQQCPRRPDEGPERQAPHSGSRRARRSC